MRDIGLCMTVKDEEANIVACLSPIADLFAQIVIIDTGSRDRTCDLLRDRFGIEPIVAELAPTNCFSLSTLRNSGFERLSTPWLMTLDADERIERSQLEAVIALDDRDLPAGLFSAWDTDYGDGCVIEDYKLNMFRSNHRHQGLIHDTVQPSLRDSGETACWSPGLRIRHVPDPSRLQEKEIRYSWRLLCARRRQPDWLRYDWFSGYMAYRNHRVDEAEAILRPVHERRPARFPVESLNASMVLAGIEAARGRRPEAEAVLEGARRYHRQVADDFEVRVNFRLGGWLEQAACDAASGRLDAVRPYAFPY